MKPLEQLSDDLLIRRLDGLSMNLFFSKGKIFVPSDIEPAFWKTLGEVRRRGAVPPLKIETLIGQDDPSPIFHDTFVVRYSSFERLEKFAKVWLA